MPLAVTVLHQMFVSDRNENLNSNPQSAYFITHELCQVSFHGKLSEPFSITLNPDVKPIQVPPNRYAAPKLPIIKRALDKLIQTGQLVRVNEPTAWISNMVVRERPASATSY